MNQLHRTDEDGHTHILRSDDPRDIVEAVINDYLAEEFPQATRTFEKLSDGWLRVQVGFLANADSEHAMSLIMDFDGLFNSRGWYECRGQGVAEDRRSQWWIVKHKAGPMI